MLYVKKIHSFMVTGLAAVTLLLHSASLPAAGKPAAEMLDGYARLKLGAVQFDLDGAYSVVRPLKSGGWAFTLVVADQRQRVYLEINAHLNRLGRVSLDSDYNRVSMVLRSSDGLAIFAPGRRLVETPSGLEQRKTAGRSNNSRKAFWKLSREERLKTGRGVVEVSKLIGNRFNLQLNVSMNDDLPAEVSGSFSGILKTLPGNFVQAARGKAYTLLKNGRFKARVVRHDQQ